MKLPFTAPSKAQIEKMEAETLPELPEVPSVVVDAPIAELAPSQVKHAEDPTRDTFHATRPTPAIGHAADPYYDTFRRNE